MELLRLYGCIWSGRSRNFVGGIHHGGRISDSGDRCNTGVIGNTGSIGDTGGAGETGGSNVGDRCDLRYIVGAVAVLMSLSIISRCERITYSWHRVVVALQLGDFSRESNNTL